MQAVGLGRFGVEPARGSWLTFVPQAPGFREACCIRCNIVAVGSATVAADAKGD